LTQFSIFGGVASIFLVRKLHYWVDPHEIMEKVYISICIRLWRPRQAFQSDTLVMILALRNVSFSILRQFLDVWSFKKHMTCSNSLCLVIPGKDANASYNTKTTSPWSQKF